MRTIPKDLSEVLKSYAPDDGTCHCDIRIKLAGDGCQYCNLEISRELERENLRNAIKKTEYKYFGDYPLADIEREAVYTLVDFVKKYIND